MEVLMENPAFMDIPDRICHEAENAVSFPCVVNVGKPSFAEFEEVSGLLQRLREKVAGLENSVFPPLDDSHRPRRRDTLPQEEASNEPFLHGS